MPRVLALRAENYYGHVLDDQLRALQRSILARDFIGKQQCIFDHARKRAQPEMHGTHLDAATLRFIHRSIYNAHRNREFVHPLAVRILYPIAKGLSAQ